MYTDGAGQAEQYAAKQSRSIAYAFALTCGDSQARAKITRLMQSSHLHAKSRAIMKFVYQHYIYNTAECERLN